MISRINNGIDVDKTFSHPTPRIVVHKYGLLTCWLLLHCDRIKEVSSKPRKEYNPKPRMTLELLPPSESHNGGIHSAKSPGRSPGEQVHVEMKGCKVLNRSLNTRAVWRRVLFLLADCAIRHKCAVHMRQRTNTPPPLPFSDLID